eukprot:scaffold61804_cov65-Phaeocystis_antarctica.AAC.2
MAASLAALPPSRGQQENANPHFYPKTTRPLSATRCNCRPSRAAPCDSACKGSVGVHPLLPRLLPRSSSRTQAAGALPLGRGEERRTHHIPHH